MKWPRTHRASAEGGGGGGRGAGGGGEVGSLSKHSLCSKPKRLKASPNCSSCVRVGRFKPGETSLTVLLD